MKKLLVTGISGFLGQELARFPQKEWSVTGLYHKNEIQFPEIECMPCDLNDFAALNTIFEKIRPEAVIHLAALSNPNYCELHPEASENVNVDVSTQFTTWCKNKGIPFLFTSTDLVFDGEYAPYLESDPIDPIMIYGKHKAQAEKNILEIFPEAIVARLPVMFGDGGFMQNWIETLQQGKTINAFRDEYRSLVSSRSAVWGLFLLLDKQVSGIWHLGGKESVSRFEFAVKMAQVFKLPVENILSSLRKEVNMPAARPANVSLDSSKAFHLGYQPPNIIESLHWLKSNRFKS